MSERSWQKRFGLLGAFVALIAVAFLLGKHLMERASAKTDCVASNGKWNTDSAVCDYGPGGAVVRLLEQGKRCQDVPDSNLRECSFSVERLEINIIGIGTSGASVVVDGSDENLGYGVAIFMREGCIRVAPGTRLKERDPIRRIEDGFVSTWTGDVYNSMLACLNDGLAVRRAVDAGEQ
ncbi:MAG: hypothetical protein Q8N23_02120 [Archangium sp.]|nr:hypothetical protein [Archangium sp.]MDP3575328.1 hypothetical protein [Archangium sp.]